VYRSAAGVPYPGRPVVEAFVKNENIISAYVFYHDQRAVRNTSILGCSIGETAANNFGLGVFNLPSYTVNGNVSYTSGTQDYFVH